MAKLRTIAANKEWLSLEEAAKELSHPLGEEVNEEDLWRFAQSNMLTISILNNSQALKYAHFCKTYDIFDHSETDKMLYDLLSKTKNAYKALLTIPIFKFNEPAPTLGRCFNGQWLGISEDADSTIESLILDLILIPITFFNFFLEELAQPHLQHDYDLLFHKELFCFMPEEEVLKRFKPYFESNLNKPITISKCDKEKKIPNTDDFLYFTENNEIFAFNQSDLTTTLEVKKTGFVAHINENDIAYEIFLPFVIRPENLQA